MKTFPKAVIFTLTFLLQASFKALSINSLMVFSWLPLVNTSMMLNILA